VIAAIDLTPFDDDRHLVLVLEAIFEVRERKLRNKTIREFLVKCKKFPEKDATWEGEQVLQHPSLQLLEDKQHLGKEDYDVPT